MERVKKVLTRARGSAVLSLFLLGSFAVHAQTDVTSPESAAAAQVAPTVDSKSASSAKSSDIPEVDDSLMDLEDAWPPGSNLIIKSCSKRCGCFFIDADDPKPNIAYADISKVRNALARECQRLVNDDPSLLNGEKIRIKNKLLIAPVEDSPCAYKTPSKNKRHPAANAIQKACNP